MAVSISLGEIGPIISYYVRIISSALSIPLSGPPLSLASTQSSLVSEVFRLNLVQSLDVLLCTSNLSNQTTGNRH